jgi:hypothetical protein
MAMWKPWLVSDQRGYADRTDVLLVAPLKTAVRIAGAPMVNLLLPPAARMPTGWSS